MFIGSEIVFSFLMDSFYFLKTAAGNEGIGDDVYSDRCVYSAQSNKNKSPRFPQSNA